MVQPIGAPFVWLLLLFVVTGCSQRMLDPQDNRFAVPETLAFTHAVAALLDYSVFEPPSLVEDEGRQHSWQEAHLASPILLHDVNEAPLFYSYPVVRGDGEIVGRIRVAANKLMGAGVVLIERNVGEWPMDAARQRAEDHFRLTRSTWVIRNTLPVVHDSPRVGLMAIAENPQTSERSKVVIDLEDLSVAPEIDLASLVAGDASIEGHVSWSRLQQAMKLDPDQLQKNWQFDHDWARNMAGLFDQAGGDRKALLNGSLQELVDLGQVKTLIKSYQQCEMHVAKVRAYYKQSTVGYCTAAAGRMIASRYDVWHSEQHVASSMGIPYPVPGGSKNWATAQQELHYYRDDPNGLKMTKSTVFDQLSVLTNTDNYKNEIMAGRPSNLRKWSTGTVHHSRVLGGIRICKTAAGQSVQLGLLDPMHPESKTLNPESWQKFVVSSSPPIGGIDLSIGGWVVVRK